MAQLEKDYPDDVRVVFRHFPLPQHDKSRLAAQAAEAAGIQGKFWEMHDLIFKEQDTWASQGLSSSGTSVPAMTVAQFEDWLKVQAAAIGLDAARFASDLKSEAVVQK